MGDAHANSANAPVRYVSIFRPDMERLYFIAASVFFVVFALNLAGVISNTDLKSQMFVIEIAVYVIFGNFVHTLFTFMMMAGLPEMRQWLKEKSRTSSIYVVAGIVLAVAAISYVKATKLTVDPFAGFLMNTIFIILVCVHVVSQMKGLSLLFSMAAKPLLSEKELEAQRRAQNRERWLFDILLWFVIGDALLRLLNYSLSLPRTHDYVFGVGLVLWVLLVANSITFPRTVKSRKTWYLLSSIFIVVAPLYPLALLLARALHGLEYTFLTYEMTKRSSLRRTNWSIPIGLLIIVTASVLLLTPPGKLFGSVNWYDSGVAATLLTIAIAVEYCHYYLDSVMFKFSDKSVSRHILPLLPYYRSESDGRT